MGFGTKGLYQVINYGPPNDMESYVQAFGRAGRGGKNYENYCSSMVTSFAYVNQRTANLVGSTVFCAQKRSDDLGPIATSHVTFMLCSQSVRHLGALLLQKCLLSKPKYLRLKTFERY